MEDLHRRVVSKRFWEEEQERIDLGTLTLLPRSAYFQPVDSNLPPRLIPIIQSLAFDSAIGLQFLQNPVCAPVLNITMTVDFLFLFKAALPFIYLLLKRTPPSADKKNSCAASRLCTNDALSLVFFQPITARLFPINSHSFPCALHSDDSSSQALDEKLRRYEHFNQSNSQVLYHQSTFQNKG